MNYVCHVYVYRCPIGLCEATQYASFASTADFEPLHRPAEWPKGRAGRDVCYGGGMMTTYGTTQADHDAALRATAHAADPATLPEAARWSGWGVNDTEVARVMLALERGTPITRTGNGRWYAPAGSPLNGRSISTVVNEMIRVGLLANVPRTALIPARTHQKAWSADHGPRALCNVPQEGSGPIRTRLVAYVGLVDCPDCLDRL